MSRQETLKAALVGLGNIAWRFGTDGQEDPLSHAAAIEQNPRTELAGGCSPDAADREAFSARYDLPVDESLDDLLSRATPDVVSICSPQEHHFAQTMQCIAAGVKRIWLEKPPASSADEVKQLIAAAEETQATVLENYMRRYASPFMKLREAVAGKALGKVEVVEIPYAPGLPPNGSHMLDAAMFLAGDGEVGEPSGVVPGNEKANPSFFFRAAGGVRVMVHGLTLPYHCADLVVTGHDGRASLLHGGETIRWERTVENELYPGFHRLVESDTHPLGEGGLTGSFAAALDDLLASADVGRPPVSNLVTALRTQQMIQAVEARLGRPR